ncbi:hypothetical protein R1sor_013702 [Riccia sorocarpa]|uniref:Uncharacterized protein n=1 Tax=Riccia sorocarpa TaxID=122646 RepID=A0ABD3H7B9_9MARC
MEIPHSSTLTAFNKTFPSLITSTSLSSFLDLELLSYIRPPLDESQKKQIIEKFQGGMASRNLPEMAPLGRAESIQGTRPWPSTQEDIAAPPIDLRALAKIIIGGTESSKKRTKDQAGGSLKKLRPHGSEAGGQTLTPRPETVADVVPVPEVLPGNDAAIPVVGVKDGEMLEQGVIQKQPEMDFLDTQGFNPPEADQSMTLT